MALPDPPDRPYSSLLPPCTVSVFLQGHQVCCFPPFFHFWRHKMQIDSNTSFDSDSDLNQENVANNNNTRQSSDCLMFGTQKALGNFTQKANEHLINAIMRQADCSGVMETIGFPKRTNWLKDNLRGWFALGGILDG